ncbi:hypothetical protein [Streptomyces sp. TLI_146]|uniref:hypothetical protein n=1 Tax=Streptomyces sp. TLI_146 TaxID=1938858 RepID=UPI0015D5925B|nr:hypothetical protein [Streptomyces sp. TLI_146]
MTEVEDLLDDGLGVEGGVVGAAHRRPSCWAGRVWPVGRATTSRAAAARELEEVM